MPSASHQHRSLGPALVGAGLALHATALWRVAVLLAGPVAAPGIAAAVAVGLLLAWRPPQAFRAGPWRALLAMVAGALVAPVALARLPAAAASAIVLALVVLAGLGVGDLRDRLRAALAGVGIGGLGAALVLPLVGPLATSLAGAILAAGGAFLLAARREAPGRAPAEATDGLPAGIGLALALAAGAATATVLRLPMDSGAHPWPAQPAAAGFMALAIAAALGMAGRTRGGGRWAVVAVGLALAALPVVPAVRAGGEALLAGMAGMRALPVVGVAGGLVVLLAGAALLALPGLGAGTLLSPRHARAGLAAFALASAVWLAHDHGATTTVTAEPPGTDQVELLRGHLVAWQAAGRLPDDLLAGHLAAMAADGRERAAVLSWSPTRSAEALRLHGVASVTQAGPPGSRGMDASVWRPSDLSRLAPLDIVISHLEDPDLAEHAPYFTRDGRAAIRRALAPGGVFIQRLSVNRLGPEGVLRQVLALREVFPETWIASADFAHGGSVLAVCLGPARVPAAPQRAGIQDAPAPADDAAAGGATAESAPPTRVETEARAPRVTGEEGQRVEPPAAEPAASADAGAATRLLEHARFEPPRGFSREIAASLREARLLGTPDLLATWVAGPVEQDALRGLLQPADAWTPGLLAFRHPAPADIARELTQAMLWGQLARVDVPMRAGPRTVPGTHPQRHDFIGLDARLPIEWTVAETVLRHANHLGRAFGRPGLSRSTARRMVLAAPGRRLEVRAHDAARGDRDMLAAALANLEGDGLMRSGGAIVHGHQALWMFEQDATRRQEVTLAYHCPLQSRLFTLELVVTDGVKPGLYDPLLALLASDMRCRHPGDGDQPGASSSGGAAAEASPPPGAAAGSPSQP